MSKFFESYLAEFVYGATDGTVTTFAVVAAAAGAGLDSSIVVIMGIANLLGDGVSMGIGAYLSSLTSKEAYHKQRHGVTRLLETKLSRATQQVMTQLRRYGFKGEQLKSATETIFSKTGDETASDFIMKEEHGLTKEPHSSWKIGFATSSAFFVVGFLPLLVYVIDSVLSVESDDLFLISAILSELIFIIIGWVRGKVTNYSKLRASMETFLLGTIAAALAFGVGYWLQVVFSV